MYIEFTDAAITLIATMIYLLCGYGFNDDMNKLYGYTDFSWPNLLVILLWPIFIFVRAAIYLYGGLFK